MKNLKNTVVSVLLAGALCFLLAGCNSSGKKEAVASLAASFCEDVKTGNTEGLMAYITDNSVSEDDLKSFIYPEDTNSEQSSYYAAIKDTISYNVDNPVIDSKTNTATVSVNWNIGDYSCENALSASDIHEFKTAVESNSKTIPVELKFDLSSDQPVLVNPKASLEAVYSYTAEDNNVFPGQLSEYCTDCELVLAPNGTYTNTDSIGVRVYFSDDVLKYRFVPGLTFTVTSGDDALFASDVFHLEESSIRFDLTTDMVDAGFINEDGFFADGTYTFMIFDEHSKEIASIECIVTNEDVEKDTVSFESFKNDHYLANLVYRFYDDDLMTHTFVYNSGWWDYDGTSVGKSAFASNTKTLGFSLAVSKENDSELFYEYYFSEESDFSDINTEEPLFESSCKPSVYDDQACYDLDFTPKDGLTPGFYGLVIYSDANKKHIVFTASCIVVEETSGDVI